MRKMNQLNLRGFASGTETPSWLHITPPFVSDGRAGKTFHSAALFPLMRCVGTAL
jgi:hypothetical protein